MEQGLIALRQHEVHLQGQVQCQCLVDHRCEEEAARAAAQSARLVEETKLEELVGKVQLKVAEADVIADANEVGLDLVADGALVWSELPSGRKPKLYWGPSAPVDKNEREEKLKEVRPAMRMVARIAQLVWHESGTDPLLSISTSDDEKLFKLGARHLVEFQLLINWAKIAKSV